MVSHFNNTPKNPLFLSHFLPRGANTRNRFADQVSDAFLNELFKHAPEARVA
jgi:S-adenosylmethionine synthetase